MSENKRTSQQWQDVLTEEDIVTNRDSGKQCVLLRALQRLSHEAGIVESGPVTLQHVPQGSFGVFQCIYEVKFDDGTTWRGAGDCNKQNVDGQFANYPTAVAESRAEARALKKALGITMLAAEEIDLSAGAEVKPNQKVSSNIVSAIETLVERSGLDTLAVIEKVLPDRADSINTLSDLTVAEGQSVMAHLNDLPKKKKVAPKASSRAAKKKAAEAVLEE
jgi:hypothetical protein